MAEVLPIEEIDQLLTAINADGKKAMDTMPPPDTRKIKIYDFKRPYKFSKEHIQNISRMHETFACLTTRSLSELLRSTVHIHVVSVNQLTYEEFTHSIPTPTTMVLINMEPLNGNAILEIDSAVTSSIIDRLFGGTGESMKAPHELTGIEAAVMEEIIVRSLGNLREAWIQVTDLQPRFCKIGTSPQFAQIVPPTDMIVLVTLETKVGNTEGLINFCIPYRTIEPIIIDKFSTAYFFGIHNPAKTKNYQLHSRDDVPVKLIAEMLSHNFSIQEINEWKVDSVLLLWHPGSQDFCFLRLGGRHVWRCEILPETKGVPKSVKILDFVEVSFSTERMENMDKVMDALLTAKMNITVELGATDRPIKEVFAMGKGSVLELDKLVGEPLDIKANGVLIARGDVVVIDENFGVRIVEIIGSHELKETSSPEPLPVIQQAPVNQES